MMKRKLIRGLGWKVQPCEREAAAKSQRRVVRYLWWEIFGLPTAPEELDLPPIRGHRQEAGTQQLEARHVIPKYWASRLPPHTPAARDGSHNNPVQSRSAYCEAGTPSTFFFPGKPMLDFLLSNER